MARINQLYLQATGRRHMADPMPAPPDHSRITLKECPQLSEGEAVDLKRQISPIGKDLHTFVPF